MHVPFSSYFVATRQLLQFVSFLTKNRADTLIDLLSTPCTSSRNRYQNTNIFVLILLFHILPRSSVSFCAWLY